jgi:hypothetical protein
MSEKRRFVEKNRSHPSWVKRREWSDIEGRLREMREAGLGYR